MRRIVEKSSTIRKRNSATFAPLDWSFQESGALFGFQRPHGFVSVCNGAGLGRDSAKAGATVGTIVALAPPISRASASRVITVMVIRRFTGAAGVVGSRRLLAARPTTRASFSSGMPEATSSRRDELARSADSSQLL
jgi:hypothetical protein